MCRNDADVHSQANHGILSAIACLLTMVISLLVILGLIEINYLTMISIYTVPVVSFLLLFFIPLVLHPNKAHLSANRPLYTKRSRICTIVLHSIYALGIIIYSTHITAYLESCLVAYSYSLLASSISRLVGSILHKKIMKG